MTNPTRGQSIMPSSAVTMGRLALAVLAIGAALVACVQHSQEASESATGLAAVPVTRPGTEPGAVIVRPARVPVAGSPSADERTVNLRPPPAGPIESHLMPIPEGSNLRPPRDGRSGQPA